MLRLCKSLVMGKSAPHMRVGPRSRLRCSPHRSTVIDGTIITRHTLFFVQKRHIATAEAPELATSAALRRIHRHLALLRPPDALTTYSPLDDPHADIYATFADAILLASGPELQTAYEYIVAAWQAVFGAPDNAYKPKLMRHCDQVIHIIMNRGNYAAFSDVVAPMLPRDRIVSRAELAMTTFQFQTDPLRRTTHVANTCAKFFASTEHPAHVRHELLALFLRKALLYFRDTMPMDKIIGTYVELARVIGPLDFLRGGPARIYRKAFRLLAVAPGPATETVSARYLAQLEHAFVRENACSYAEFGAALLCMMAAAATDAPHAALAIWRYKHATRQPCTAGDLGSAMAAHYALNDHEAVVDMYTEHRDLHDDAHIELLLKVAARRKDGAALQDQFEDMYGRGNLPQPVHYAKVMSALADLGAHNELALLMQQLRLRNLRPSATIYRALLQLELNRSDVAAAQQVHTDFLARVGAEIPPEHAAKLLSLVLQLAAFLPDPDAIQVAVDDLERRLCELGWPLFDAEAVLVLLRLAAATYSIALFERAHAAAIGLGLCTDLVWHAMITTLTQLGAYERADALAHQAHADSDVPYQNLLVLSAQLKNCRVWARDTRDRVLREQIDTDAARIVAQTDRGLVSVRDRAELLTECAKVQFRRGAPEAARVYLLHAWSVLVPAERHFVPLLRYYHKNRHHAAHSRILALYEDMVARRVSVSALTYYYVVNALLALQKGRSSSGPAFRLMQPVLSFYGLDPAAENPRKVPVVEFSRAAVPLIRIFCDFLAEPGNSDASAMTAVLARFHACLGPHVPVNVRRDVYAALARLYLLRGDVSTARTLIDKALAEYHALASALPENPPKLFSVDYRAALDTKLLVLRVGGARSGDYEDILHQLLQHNIEAHRGQFDAIFKQLIGTHSSWETFVLVLRCCERFLVSGNMADVRLLRLVGGVYRQFIAYHAQHSLAHELETRFGIFSRLYGVNVAEVQRTLLQGVDMRMALENELQKLPRAHQVPVETLLGHPALLFAPELRSWQRNYINPIHASQLVKLLDHYCAQDRASAYALYEQYPETFEYLLIFREERYRLVAFRNEMHRFGAGYAGSRETSRRQTVAILDSVCS